MNLTADNVRIFSRVLRSWIKSSLQVVFSKPSVYLSPILEADPVRSELTRQNRIIARKVVKGTRKLSPLFRKSRKCLMEALIVYDVLSGYEIPSEFKLGTGTSGKDFEAHAWIEVEGKSVIGGAISGYRELTRIR